MPQPSSELLLQRVLAYWQWSGVALDAATQQQALAIVTRALEEPAEQRLAYCLQALQAALPPTSQQPDACPPLRRGSMHYGDY
tara:strand:- start:293 stop:541 length:249 start_codon:yes stop_codon:yes gene_type:complete